MLSQKKKKNAIQKYIHSSNTKIRLVTEILAQAFLQTQWGELRNQTHIMKNLFWRRYLWQRSLEIWRYRQCWIALEFGPIHGVGQWEGKLNVLVLEDEEGGGGVEDNIVRTVVWGVEIRFRHQYIRVGVKGLECSDPSITWSNRVNLKHQN